MRMCADPAINTACKWGILHFENSHIPTNSQRLAFASHSCAHHGNRWCATEGLFLLPLFLSVGNRSSNKSNHSHAELCVRTHQTVQSFAIFCALRAFVVAVSLSSPLFCCFFALSFISSQKCIVLGMFIP